MTITLSVQLLDGDALPIGDPLLVSPAIRPDEAQQYQPKDRIEVNGHRYLVVGRTWRPGSLTVHVTERAGKERGK